MCIVQKMLKLPKHHFHLFYNNNISLQPRLTTSKAKYDHDSGSNLQTRNQQQKFFLENNIFEVVNQMSQISKLIKSEQQQQLQHGKAVSVSPTQDKILKFHILFHNTKTNIDKQTGTIKLIHEAIIIPEKNNHQDTQESPTVEAIFSAPQKLYLNFFISKQNISVYTYIIYVLFVNSGRLLQKPVYEKGGTLFYIYSNSHVIVPSYLFLRLRPPKQVKNVLVQIYSQFQSEINLQQSNHAYKYIVVTST
eukprot:TRINITY_DN1460_c1_g1_i2.p1 TRINITY_DN1460_c1_g1~~TRINITY_DN1460_c1_g1_i2.p1  ORF type:complete len:249 (+),score=-14.36 TRINITY_DN1460_c1_g1_i2:157-903(+)